MFPFMIGQEVAGSYRAASEHCLKKLASKDLALQGCLSHSF